MKGTATNWNCTGYFELFFGMGKFIVKFLTNNDTVSNSQLKN
jgi:hypothetical protein